MNWRKGLLHEEVVRIVNEAERKTRENSITANDRYCYLSGPHSYYMSTVIMFDFIFQFLTFRRDYFLVFLPQRLKRDCSITFLLRYLDRDTSLIFFLLAFISHLLPRHTDSRRILRYVENPREEINKLSDHQLLKRLR